jgi:hypothetical protein
VEPACPGERCQFWGAANRFGFNIGGTPDIPLVIQASTDPAARSWISLQSCTLTNGLIYFSDPQWTNFPGRFYRIRSPWNQRNRKNSCTEGGANNQTKEKPRWPRQSQLTR